MDRSTSAELALLRPKFKTYSIDVNTQVMSSVMTPERIAASTAVLTGLIGAVIGGLALSRSAGPAEPAIQNERALS
jgi:hypothetical protein